MSTSLSLGLVIGASVASGFQFAMSTVNKTVEKLKTTTEALNIKQEQLKQKIKSMPEGASGIVKLQHEYSALGKTIERVAKQQASLKRSIEAGAQLKQQRADLRTNMTETVGVAAATLLPVYGGVKAAGNHEDNVKDIAITGEFDATQEAQLSKTIRAVSLQMNQTSDAISAGLKSLVAGIQSADELNQYAPVIAKTATATRAEMDDISNTFLALSNNMGISAKDSYAAMNIMIKATKLGQVEFKDMSKWMPQLTPIMQALGISGKEGIAQLASLLEIAKIGAGTADEAGNNLKNLLTKITAPETKEDFKKAGIDIEQSLKDQAAKGVNPIDAMLGIVQTYMQKQSSTNPELKKQFDAAMAEKDQSKAEKMLKGLVETNAMGVMFQDMQAMSALRALLQNREKYESFKQESIAAGNQDLLSLDYQKRVSGFNEQIKQLKISLIDIGMTIGDAVIPAILNLVEFVKPAITAFGEFAKSNAGMVSFGVQLLAGGLAAKLFGSSVAFGWNLLVRSPINQLATTWKNLSAAFNVAKIGLTNFLPIFVKGILAAGKALLFFGRALLTTPLGLIIAGVAALAYGAYQLYENWEPIKAWFSDLWQSIGDAVWEKTALMSMTIEGWIGGIKSWFTELKTWFTNLWDSLIGDALKGITELKSQANSLLPESLKFDVKPLDVPEPSSFNSTRGTVIDQSTVHFTPSIVLPAGTPEQTVSSVKQALSISQTEFEQRYKQMQRNNNRLNFAGQ